MLDTRTVTLWIRGILLRMDHARVWRGIGLAAAFSVGLLGLRVALFYELTFGYMVWNLLLAALPLGFVVVLKKRLRTSSWLDAPNILLTALWLGFLPNSFYLVTDLIHIAEVTNQTLLFDSVMHFSFAVTGLMLGYAAVIPVHQALLARVSRASAHRVMAGVFLLCGYAIYLGRYMRWNTWDVLINPIGLLSNVVDSLTSPHEGAPLILTTLLFFWLISVLYIVLHMMQPSILSGKHPRKQVK